jgi:hypothetical protein
MVDRGNCANVQKVRSAQRHCSDYHVMVAYSLFVVKRTADR